MDKIFEKVYSSGLPFLSPLTPEQTYKILVEEARKLSHATWGSVYMTHRNHLKKVYASHPLLMDIKPRKKGNVYQVFYSNTPLILEGNNLASTLLHHKQFKEIGVRSH